jgi:hypothetical protein
MALSPSTNLGILVTNIDCVSCTCINSTSSIYLRINIAAVEAYYASISGTMTQLYNEIILRDVFTGLVVETIEYAYSPMPGSGWINQLYNPVPTLAFDGQYTIDFKVKLVNDAGAIFAENVFTLNSCSTLELNRVDCNIYTWENKGAIAELKLKKANSDGSFTVIETRSGIAVGAIETWTLNDGVFILEVYRASTLEYSYKLLGMCSVINCLTSFTKAIACSDPCSESSANGDCGCEDCNNNAIISKDNFYLLSITYLALVNKMYIGNVLFYELDTQSATTLQDLALIQDRLTKYCSGCP